MSPDPFDNTRGRNAPTSSTCAHMQPRLLDLLDGLLAEPQAGELRRHLETCAVCRREWNALQVSDQALNTARISVPSPGDLRSGFYARLAAQPSSQSRFRALNLGLAVPATVLTACLLFVLFRPATLPHRLPAARPQDRHLNGNTIARHIVGSPGLPSDKKVVAPWIALTPPMAPMESKRPSLEIAYARTARQRDAAPGSGEMIGNQPRLKTPIKITYAWAATPRDATPGHGVVIGDQPQLRAAMLNVSRIQKRGMIAGELGRSFFQNETNQNSENLNLASAANTPVRSSFDIAFGDGLADSSLKVRNGVEQPLSNQEVPGLIKAAASSAMRSDRASARTSFGRYEAAEAEDPSALEVVNVHVADPKRHFDARLTMADGRCSATDAITDGEDQTEESRASGAAAGRDDRGSE